MIHAPKTIHVEPGSGLDRPLEEATTAPVELEKSGVRYRVTCVEVPVTRTLTLADEHDIWSGYDPTRVRDSLRQSAGALRGVDREQLLKDLTEQRAQDSRGRPA